MAAVRRATDEKYDQILKTAAAIFAKKGYHQASIRDISRATGISLSGLYYYVDSKEEILFRIQEHCFETVLQNLEEMLEGVADPTRRLRLLVENHLRFFVNNMAEMKVLSHEAEALGGEYRDRINGLKRRYAEVGMDILAGIRADGGFDPRVATFGLFGMMNWIYNWYRPERDIPVEELSAQMTRLFLRGFREADDEESVTPEMIPGDRRPSIWRR